MLIRPALETDLDPWLRMRLLLWPGHSADEHLAEMHEYLDREDRLTLVAEKSSQTLAGFLEASIRTHAQGCESSRVGYVEEWYVDVARRTTGIGGMLVREAESWARANGCTEMASDCELTNEISFAAHLKLGYEESGRLIHFRKRLE